MNRDKLTPERAVDRFFESLGEPAATVTVDRSADRTLRYLEREYGKLPPQLPQTWNGALRRPWRWLAIAATAMILAASLSLLRVDTGVIATVEGGVIVAQGHVLRAKQPLRVGADHARLLLADGSRVELRAQSDFSIVRVSDGIELQLHNGVALVTAAKQKSGHLYVRTPDCIVSVTGTVFSVRSEEAGSRVSVFEGQVRVQQRDMTYTLSRGEQLATSPMLGASGLEGELQWSSSAETVLALLRKPEQFLTVQPGEASAEGLVTNVATGAPLAGVTIFVTASRASRELLEVKSGNDGRFKIDHLPPGAYKFVASLEGFWATSGPDEVRFIDGQAIRGVRLGMSPVATVSGRVVDENGQPARSERLALWSLDRQSVLRLATDAGAAGGVTNERGEYEFTNVLPGKYYIKTMPKVSPDAGVYYPGSLDADDALPVELAPGTVLTGINFALPAVKLYSIRFRVPSDSLQWIETVYSAPGSTQGLMAAGFHSQSGSTFATPLFTQASSSKVSPAVAPAFNLQRLGKLAVDTFDRLQAPGQAGSSRLTSLVNDEYILRGVPPGRYHLTLSWNGVLDLFEPRSDGRYIQSSARVDAEVEVVDKDVDLGKLASKPASLSIPVRFTYADGTPSEVAILAESTEQLGSRTLLNSLSSTLRLNNLRAGQYMLRFTLARPDRYVSIARYGTQDALAGAVFIDGADHGVFEVVIDGPAGSVEGVVRDGKGETIAGVGVVLIPTQYRRANRYLFQTVRTDQDGKYRFSGVAPGDYGVYSWESAPSQAYFDPVWLRDYEIRGTPVTVRKGQNVTAGVLLIP